MAQLDPATDSASRARSLIEQARQVWIDRLMDRSRRNNLLYYCELLRGTLDLTAAPPPALAAAGIATVPQWGVGRYRIDLAAQHPEQPGRFVLAIECDGATYHAAPTARDRDRLRQQHLEALGWRFHRIWSTDWFMDRESEIERAVVAYRLAVAAASAPHSVEVNSPAITVSKEEPPEAAPSAPTVTERTSRPPVRPRGVITEYSNRELAQMVVWLLSDGQLRTDDEILDELLPYLGLSRRGARIEAALRQAIASARTSAPR